MSEKATLLTSIPPVSKSEPVKKTSLLTPSDSQLSESDKILQSLDQSSKPKSILSQVNGSKGDSGSPVKNLNLANPTTTKASEVVSIPMETVAVDPVAEDDGSGGTSMVAVVSIVLVLCLVVVAIFVFLRKSKGAEKPSAVSWEDRKKAKVASSPQPTAKKASGPDPIIEFLKEEGAESAVESPSTPTPIKTVEQIPAGTPPPPKSNVSKSLPPKNPNSSAKPLKAAPNAPSQIKAPSKPKKRF